MRKLFSFVTLLFLSVSVSAQIGVTRFLGIPVDGTKAEMIQKLKAKGFKSNLYDKEILEGEFNGKNVRIHVVTNKDKVYRIMVVDAVKTDETNIKINFNNLCHQFSNNKKYIPISGPSSDYTIPESEDIDYEMSIHNKRYEAAFYQLPDINDTTALIKETHSFLLTKFTEDVLSNPTEEQKEEIKDASMQYLFDMVEKNSVWFMINKNYGEYSIVLYYDNERNQANGEDL